MIRLKARVGLYSEIRGRTRSGGPISTRSATSRQHSLLRLARIGQDAPIAVNARRPADHSLSCELKRCHLKKQ
jgi:hypothetical protein